MPFPLTAAGLSVLVSALLGALTRYGHQRKVPGALLVLVWNHVRAIERQVAGILARLEAGTLRRVPFRRPPRLGAARSRPAPCPFPPGHGWLIARVPETAVLRPALEAMLDRPDLPALLEAAPQLRRALRPLCRMLALRLPPPAPVRHPAPRKARPRAATPHPAPPPPPPAWPPSPPRPAAWRAKPA